MRTLAGLLLSLALFACARSDTPEPTEVEAPTQPTEVEGPAPATEPVAAPNEEQLCAIGSSPQEWSACDGKRVQLRGKNPEAVMQHPILAVPEDLAPDGRNTHQGYMDAGGAQLIVLTKAPFDCAGDMSAVGTLRGVDLGGDTTTRGKNSYGGWVLEDAEVTCE